MHLPFRNLPQQGRDTCSLRRCDAEKRSIEKRYTARSDAEHYRDRFARGRRRRAHLRETTALRMSLHEIGMVDRILDVGCGTGRFAPLLAAQARRLVLSDFSINMLDVCRSDSRKRGEMGDYVQADARDLPFASNVFDVVFCHRLLNHVPHQVDRRHVVELGRVATICPEFLPGTARVLHDAPCLAAHGRKRRVHASYSLDSSFHAHALRA